MHDLDRRTLLRGALGLGIASTTRALWACGCEATSADIEGPYYLPGAPLRSVLVEPGMEGERLTLAGVVRDEMCHAVGGATLEFWQCDARGVYDVRGMRLRARMETDAQGRFELQTIVPGRYLNGPRYRPAHIHLKVRPRGGRELTTQLYFAGDPYNQGDPWFNADRALHLQPQSRGFAARFSPIVG